MTEVEARNDWVGHDHTRKTFWAVARDLGLSDDEAKRAIGVVDENGELTSTYAFEGTLDEAVDLLTEYAAQQKSDKSAAAVRAAGEPPCVLFSQVLSKKGFEINFTVRGATIQDAIDEFGRMTTKLTDMGCTPLVNDRWQQTVTATQQAPRQQAPAPQRQQAPQPQQAPARGNQGGGEYPNHTQIKTGNVTQVEVKPSGQVLISADSAKWPLKDSRGGEVVASLFGQDCWSANFTPDSLSTPGWYQPQGLVVTYGKSNTGFWDILNVEAA